MVQQTYKRSISGSVGSGMKSVFGGSGRRFYTLEHKVSSKYHKAGECQQIIVDQIELGRDPKCQVRFDESFTTVSRRHAAIVRDGDKWKLVQLSQTNSTYLNGRKIENEWYLQNGDEIQLSTNGPKLGFIADSGDKGLVKSIGLTARLNLFRQQALRPYKQALTALSCLLVLVIVGCSIGYKHMGGTIDKLEKQLADNKVLVEQYRKELEKRTAEYEEQLVAFKASMEKMKNDAKINEEELKKTVESLRREIGISREDIEKCLKNIYFIQTIGYELHLDGGNTMWLCSDEEEPAPGWSGTGFLLEDNKFVTARHVIEGWNYDVSNAALITLNILSNKGRVVAHYMAVSPTGETLHFTDKYFTMDKRNDRFMHDEEGNEFSYSGSSMENDFAYADYVEIGGKKTNDGLKYDKELSRQLKQGTVLAILGFPFGLGANAIDDIKPQHSKAEVSSDGLDNGVILTNNTGFEQGNSGGPVLCYDNSGNVTVIGIVSAGMGNATGFVVPISKIK